MADLPNRVRQRGAETLRGLKSRRESTHALRKRVATLEDEMQETRRLNRRLAELMDVVEELLVPLSQQDRERVETYLESNTTRMGGEPATDQSGDSTDDRRG